jgi:hypothetical protein
MPLNESSLTVPRILTPDLPGEYAALALKAEQDVLGLANEFCSGTEPQPLPCFSSPLMGLDVRSQDFQCKPAL